MKQRFKRDIEYSSNGIVSKQILKSSGGNITLFAFDESQGLSSHTSPYEAMILVLEGEAEISIDRETYQMKEEESIHLPANIPHGVKGITQMKMLLIMLKSDE